MVLDFVPLLYSPIIWRGITINTNIKESSKTVIRFKLLKGIQGCFFLYLLVIEPNNTIFTVFFFFLVFLSHLSYVHTVQSVIRLNLCSPSQMGWKWVYEDPLNPHSSLPTSTLTHTSELLSLWLKMLLVKCQAIPPIQSSK